MKIKRIKTESINTWKYTENDILNKLAEEISKEISDDKIISVNAKLVMATANSCYGEAIVSYKD